LFQIPVGLEGCGGERGLKGEGISESDTQKFSGNVSSILEIIV